VGHCCSGRVRSCGSPANPGDQSGVSEVSGGSVTSVSEVSGGSDPSFSPRELAAQTVLPLELGSSGDQQCRDGLCHYGSESRRSLPVRAGGGISQGLFGVV